MENDVQRLVNILPPEYREHVTDLDELIEVVLDYGRPLELRYKHRFVILEHYIITQSDLDYVLSQVNEFGPDERAGIDGTLHRISRIVSRNGKTAGLTCRVGKAVTGSELLIEDLLLQGKSMLVVGAPGAGKAQPLISKLLTPKGWKLMRDIQLGDEVISIDGTPTKVVGIYPQGEKETFKISTSEGASTLACGEHLWSTYQKTHRGRSTELLVSSTEQLKSSLFYNSTHLRHSLPEITGPFNLTMSPPKIDPYFLGLLLGDGCTSSNFQISSADPEIIEFVKNYLHPDYRLTFIKGVDWRISRKEGKGKPCIYRKVLRELGVWGKRSWEKCVPQEMLFCCTYDRLCILQGLLDTDGTVDKKGSIQFDSTSKQLAEDVAFIVYSLGGIPHTTVKSTSSGRLSYRVTISGLESYDLFRLPRKLERCTVKAGSPNKLKSTRRYIKSIESMGVMPVQCIKVDHPSQLYITDDCIPTHNTTLLRSCANLLADDSRVIIVDTSDEISGAGIIPHPAVGRARKMSVPFGRTQYEILLQAVENHWPQVLIVDEISDVREVEAVRTVTRRGIQLLGTVHGCTLEDVMNNPTLNYLLGGIKTVTLGDEEAKLRGTSKTIMERQYEPTFDIIVELVDFDIVRVYSDVKAVVDAKLAGSTIYPEERRILDGKMKIVMPAKFMRASTPVYEDYRSSKPRRK